MPAGLRNLLSAGGAGGGGDGGQPPAAEARGADDGQRPAWTLVGAAPADVDILMRALESAVFGVGITDLQSNVVFGRRGEPLCTIGCFVTRGLRWLLGA